MEDKPRYSRISDILDLAVFIQSRPLGVTIGDIIKRYNVSRRTAERMRDSLICIFPQIDVLNSNDNQKHWGFVNYSINNFISFAPKEIANLKQLQRRTTNKELKTELGSTIDKIQALSLKKSVSTENNIERYLHTEGYAVRQMPQYKIDIKILECIRQSLQYSKKIKCIYHSKSRILEPLGLVYGEKIYLVAREKNKCKEQPNAIYNYLLHKFTNMELTENTFDKSDFNLQNYTNQSFGVYHGEILEVKLLFSKELSQDAMNYDFHPTQKIKLEKDGTVTVTFNASGDKEIMWHVFKWGAGCKILEPKSLVSGYQKYLEENLKNYRG